ncbi:C1 family peptidase [Myroides sp. LJL115]
MKKIIISLSLLFMASGAMAQKYDFKTIIDLDAYPVTSQGNTGTCWSFSTSSFLESEIMRISNKRIDLSEMYNVRNTYPKKIENYITRQSKAQFGEGGLAHDVINSVRDYGLVPQDVYSGYQGSDTYNHSELFKALQGLINVYAKNNGPISMNWKPISEFILDTYMGDNPTEFTYEGTKYTPMSFLEMTGINPNDYLTITSFANQQNYAPFILNIPDNFSNGSLYNMPLQEYIDNIDYALDNGFTLSLDCDVSEKGFSSKEGVAFVALDPKDNEKGLTQIIQEKQITPTLRLEEFYSYDTNDDHLMHIVGKVKDKQGNIYYKVKNSWGSDPDKVGHQGYIYMSLAYLKLKSISVLLHKDGLLPQTKTNLKIQ